MTDTATAAPAGKIQPRLKQKYKTEIAQALTEANGYTNPHQVPGLDGEGRHEAASGRRTARTGAASRPAKRIGNAVRW